MLRSFLITTVLATALVSAHIEMMFPPPINSKYDPQTLEANKDYSMTSPLLTDGSNYPCKGYNTASAYSSLNSVATLKAGGTFDVEFAAGGAVHGGGSCQFSVSYDQGKTFAVIHSIIGDCPLQSTYSVPIPSTLPSATKATFAWTWLNLIGNREEYMNCAIVDIQGSSAKSYTGPGLYRANTLAGSSYGTCVTTEHVTPVYPNPGSSVAYGDGMSKASAVTVLEGCSYNEDTTVTISTSGSSSSGGSKPSSAASTSKATTTTSKAAATTSNAAATTTKQAATTTKPAATTTHASAASSAASITKTTVASRVPWTDRQSSAAAVRQSSAAAASSRAAASSSRAAASAAATSRSTTASHSAATTAAASRTASSASPAATATGSNGGNGGTWLSCTSKSTFSLCDSNGCTPMGSVAPGTQCVNGAIAALPLSPQRMARVVKRSGAGAASPPAQVQKRAQTAGNARAHVVRSSRSNGH